MHYYCLVYRRSLISTLFPYTTLFRSALVDLPEETGLHRLHAAERRVDEIGRRRGDALDQDVRDVLLVDRKSTRLNSSHVETSYAVFCLKKKIYRKEKLSRQCRNIEML